MENKNRKKIGIKYGEEIESELYKLSGFIEEKNNDAQNPGSRWIALKMLEQDSDCLLYTSSQIIRLKYKLDKNF